MLNTTKEVYQADMKNYFPSQRRSLLDERRQASESICASAFGAQIRFRGIEEVQLSSLGIHCVKSATVSIFRAYAFRFSSFQDLILCLPRILFFGHVRSLMRYEKANPEKKVKEAFPEKAYFWAQAIMILPDKGREDTIMKTFNSLEEQERMNDWLQDKIPAPKTGGKGSLKEKKEEYRNCSKAFSDFFRIDIREYGWEDDGIEEKKSPEPSEKAPINKSNHCPIIQTCLQTKQFSCGDKETYDLYLFDSNEAIFNDIVCPLHQKPDTVIFQTSEAKQSLAETKFPCAASPSEELPKMTHCAFSDCDTTTGTISQETSSGSNTTIAIVGPPHREKTPTYKLYGDSLQPRISSECFNFRMTASNGAPCAKCNRKSLNQAFVIAFDGACKKGFCGLAELKLCVGCCYKRVMENKGKCPGCLQDIASEVLNKLEKAKNK